MHHNEIKKRRLQYFADHAKEGFTLVTYFKKPFIHRLDELGIGHKIINPKFTPYLHADGSPILTYGNVIQFQIKSLKTIEEGKMLEFTTTSKTDRKVLTRMYQDILDIDFDFMGFTGDFSDPRFVPECRY